MKTPNILVISIISLLIAISCDQENVKSSKTELLTSNIWVSDPTDNVELAEYESDDTWIFSGNKYINSKGNLLSHPNEKDIKGSWKWTENESKLQIEINDITQEFDVIELTPTSLKLVWKDFAEISFKAK